MTKYELNPRKIAFRALQIQDKVFDNGGISMYQFSFPEKERLNMIKERSHQEMASFKLLYKISSISFLSVFSFDVYSPFSTHLPMMLQTIRRK